MSDLGLILASLILSLPVYGLVLSLHRLIARLDVFLADASSRAESKREYEEAEAEAEAFTTGTSVEAGTYWMTWDDYQSGLTQRQEVQEKELYDPTIAFAEHEAGVYSTRE